MSRAFVKESDGDEAYSLPERPLPAHVNYVTARGLAQLQARARELASLCEALRLAVLEDNDPDHGARLKLRAAERDLRYFHAQLERAEPVAPAAQHDEIHFGARVRYADESGAAHRVHIVGDDEADAAAGDISWASPLARALLGARVGDVVTWHRPAGAAEIEILHIHYE